MNKILTLVLMLTTAVMAQAALTTNEIAAINLKVAKAKRPELPAVVQRLVQEAKPADRHVVQGIALDAVAKTAPAALHAVVKSIRLEDETVPPPPAYRPPVTPGNVNGNRPEVPPGLNKYGSP